ncbi:hypothetical protein ACIBTP_40960 [Streptomyces avidinii]|uniref:hypothetical protein n=1 Tax=Streptomyces TaxID=1883 RepID=UPI000F4318DF|nr:hypothetical protein [Streptomyces sp. ADI95-16]AYV26347.1 hypothetical protein EES41_06390 [Streptomyces sp. ADI95-16]
MTFILLTCAPMLAPVLLAHREPHTPRHRRPGQAPRITPRKTLIHCCLMPPQTGATA